MNNCIFTGRTTREIECKETQNGKKYAKFNLANETRFGDRRNTNFFSMTVWGKLAESMEKYVAKGTKIAVTCEAQQEKYTNKNGAEIDTIGFIVKDFEFCEKRLPQETAEQEEVNTQEKPQPSNETVPFEVPDNIPDDVLPFN